MRAYAQILRVPGGALSSAAAFVARLPLSMGALGIVLLVSDRTGSYRTAGVVAAFYIVAAAVSGPLQGRIVDRIGQQVVLVVAAALLASGVLVFVAVVEAGATLGPLAATAALAGLGAPQSGSFVRARWTHLLRGRPRELQTAFAFEAVVDEVVFVTGPILVTAIATTIDPVAGLHTAAGLSLLGSLALAALASSEPPRSRGTEGPRPPLSPAFIVAIVAVAIGIGILFGATEVIVVAFTDEREARHLAGFVLAAWAFGSLLSGLVVGMRPPPRSQLRRLQITALLLGITFAPLLFVDSIAILALAMVVGGTMIAPSLISTMSLVESQVPRARLTEGIAWASTGLAAGVAPGAALAGQVVDAAGAAAAFAVPLAAGVAASLVALTVLARAVTATVGLRRYFSNPSKSRRTLVSHIIKGSTSRRTHRGTDRSADSRGPMRENSSQPQTRLSASNREALLAGYTEGVPVRELAERFNIHRSTVREIARRAGHPSRAPEHPERLRVEAARLYAEGFTLNQVAEKSGIGDASVRSAVLAHGGTIRPKGRRRIHG